MGKTKIYCFPGQGADRRLFDFIKVDTALYKLDFVEYGTPAKNMTMHEFALQLSQKIDTTENFILMGVSLGGMICTELTEFLNPQKTILISSAKNRNELPWRYRFQKVIPLYKIFSPKILLAGAKILQPIVEPDSKKYKDIFNNMLASKDKIYMKRTIGLIINWDRINNSKDFIHIHGDNDHTIPLRNIKDPNYIVKDGSHMMTLTRAGEISEILDEVLSN